MHDEQPLPSSPSSAPEKVQRRGRTKLDAEEQQVNASSDSEPSTPEPLRPTPLAHQTKMPTRLGSLSRASTQAAKPHDGDDANAAILKLVQICKQMTAELERTRRVQQQQCSTRVLTVVVVGFVVAVCLAFCIQSYRRLKASTDYLAWCCEQRMQSSPIFRPMG